MGNTLIAQLNNPAMLLQLSRKAATVVSLLLIIACAYLLVQVTWMFLPQDDAGMAPAKTVTQPIVNTSRQDDSFRKLTSANIFGVSEKAAVQQPSKAPETKLNLTLKGVLAATSMEMASAIIAQGKAGKEEIYSIGDRMPGNVLIKEIHPEYVVLERGGRLETLKLQKISGVSGIETSNTSSLSSRRAGGSPATQLKQIRSNILKDPTSFGEYALPVVVKENGKQIGYRLKAQKKGELLAKLGIQSTDVITQINGVKLDQPQNGISALRKLSTATNLDIVVRRNGAEVPLNISLQ
jgi:general secretion pathway protein C